MSVRRPALLLAVTCAAVLAAPSVAAAAPRTVTCGSTVTVDTVLRHDLTCAGEGLVLEPGVTLDLRGHTLRGPGSGVGVLVSSVGEIEVRNGTLVGWEVGVDILGVDDESLDTGPLSVERVRFRDNAIGVDASGEDGSGRYRKPTTITRSTFVGHTAAAVEGQWFGTVTVDRSTFTDNATAVSNNGDIRIRDSRFVRNDLALAAFESVMDVERSVFEDNTRGAASFGTSSVSVVGSRFVGSDVALDADRMYLDLRTTTFTGNDVALVLGWMGGTVTENVMRSNGKAITNVDDINGGTDIQNNTLRHNGEGIVLDAAGVNVGVGGNDVRGSAGWGIHVPGVTDLGGNTARGNGSTPQCVGVVCRQS